jgi:uncharacterized membrane protein YbhN (UPF0104 family)
MAEEQRRRFLPLVRKALTVLALVAVALAFRDALADAGSVEWPGLPRLLVSWLLAALGVLSAAWLWSGLFPDLSYRDLVTGFSTAQLAKYLPGSVWQGVGQVLDAVRLGSGYARASALFVLQMWIQVIAGAVVALPILGSLSTAQATVALVAIAVATATMWRPILVRVVATVLRWWRRNGNVQEPPTRLIPDQRQLLRSWSVALQTMLIVAASFAVLLGGTRVSGFVPVIGAFAAAWVLGFLVVPLPAGVGVRELALVTLLGDEYGASSVLAAAVIHRLVTVAAEVAVAGSVAGLRRQR